MNIANELWGIYDKQKQEKRIKLYIENFLSFRKEGHRYTSFDYCYNYFYNFYKNDKINEIWNNENLEQSCLQLWFYLASRGMMRGSSFLLQNSLKVFKKLILSISKLNKEYREIDLDNYNEGGIEKLLSLKNIIVESFWEDKPTDTLATKIMLWIFANIPAFDRYFKKWMKVSRVNKDNLLKIYSFYNKNKSAIDLINVKTIDFISWEETSVLYKKAKLIDMFWFSKWYGP